MHTLPSSQLTTEDIAQLEHIIETEDRPNVRRVIETVTALARSGGDIHFISTDEEFTPSAAAKKLKMSRTHLYKLLDRGEIPFYQVGAHRRIRAHDLAQFEEKRRADKNELAEKFFHKESVIRSAEQYIEDLL